jgi:hypothetical protein
MDKKKRTFWIILAALLVVGIVGIGISLGDVGISRTATGGDGSKGVYGEATNTGDVRNYGGFFVADGGLGRGVYGKASNIGDYINYGGFFYALGTEGRGVFGQAAGSNGYGVKGWASNDGDVENYGGHFCAAGSKGIGVYGWAENEGSGENYGGYFVANGSEGTGVYGKGKEGGYFTTTTAGSYGNKLAGVNVSTDYTFNPGIRIKTAGQCSNGVNAYTTGYSSHGVYARTDDDDSWGVYAHTYGNDSDGVNAHTLGDSSHGVWAHTTGYYSHGVLAHTYGDDSNGVSTHSSKGYGVYATGKKAGIYAEGLGEYAAVFNGRTTTKVLEITGGSDLSEQFEIRGIEAEVSPSPGMVVSIDPERPGELVVSNNAYDWRVAGIISGAGGLNPGMLMGQNGSEADGGYPVALSGRVYCWADASKGPIEPGDLLTTSETPGHAMKVTDHDRAYGAIIGKAMSGLEEGKGLVLVLVALQ